MRSRFWCVGAMAILFVSTITSGEIVSYTTQYEVGVVDNDPEVASITCNANGITLGEAGYADGEHIMYTTENANNLAWSYELYAWAEGELTVHNLDLAVFESYAYAYGYCEHAGDPNEVTAFLDQSVEGEAEHYYFHNEWWDGEYYIRREGNYYNNFDAYDGVTCRHAAFASASVTEGGTSSAFAHVCARAIPGLWVYW